MLREKRFESSLSMKMQQSRTKSMSKSNLHLNEDIANVGSNLIDKARKSMVNLHIK